MSLNYACILDVVCLTVNLRKVGVCAWIIADCLQHTGLENPASQEDPHWMFSSVCMVRDRFERPSCLPHKTSFEKAYGKDSHTLAHFFASRPPFPVYVWVCRSVTGSFEVFLNWRQVAKMTQLQFSHIPFDRGPCCKMFFHSDHSTKSTQTSCHVLTSLLSRPRWHSL